MKILFYIPNLNQRSGGIRQYSLALLQILGKLEIHQIFVLHNTEDKEVLNIIESYINLKLIPLRVGKERSIERKIYLFSYALNFLMEKGFNKRIRVRSYLDRICKKYKVDIVHSPFQDQPFPTKTKNIFTLHDVQELHFPEYFTPEEREERARKWLYNTKRADKIVVSYNHIKSDIIKYFDIRSENIHVIFLNMENLWFNRLNRNIDSIYSNSDFSDFILYPANTWEHKNHLRLIESIAHLRENYGVVVNLICTGSKSDHYVEILKKINQLKLESQIKFLGIISQEDLLILYHSCRGVVIPTIYEAGSFPLMESILMEIPVICSNVTSLPDTIGNIEYVFDPFDVNDISSKIKLLWQDCEFRKKNKFNSSKIKEHLINTGASQKILSLYKELQS